MPELDTRIARTAYRVMVELGDLELGNAWPKSKADGSRMIGAAMDWVYESKRVSIPVEAQGDNWLQVKEVILTYLGEVFGCGRKSVTEKIAYAAQADVVEALGRACMHLEWQIR